MLEHMSPFDFLPHSLQDDLLIFTSSHLKQIFIYSKAKDMFIQNSLIKATPSKASLCKCPVRRDIITWDLNLKDLVTNGQGK